MFANAYHGRSVFITGHTGFKGSWLCLWLESLGAKVTGYSLGIPTSPSHFEACPPTLAADKRGDVRDLAALKAAIAEAKPDIVFHMAAQPIVRLSYAEPVETISTNVMGTATVLQACRGVESIKGIVNITSDKCYENVGKREGYIESDPMGGHDPYSASKGCAELIAASYARAFADLAPMVSVRAGNVIGGGDWAADRLIPDIARGVLNQQDIIIRSPQAIRPWQHVMEPLSGYLLLGQKLLQGDTSVVGGWNFGPHASSTLTVGDVIERLSKHMETRVRVEPAPASLHEASLLTLDSTKAHKLVGWEPVWDADEMIAATAAWYSAFITNKQCIAREQLKAFAHDAAARGRAWAN